MAEPSFVAAPKVFGVEVLAVLRPLLVPTFFVPTATAGERNVTAAEANGTYRDVEGKREIKILAVGHSKLKVQLALVYEYQSGAGPTANVDDASGEATIENDIAVFVPEEAGDCKITMTFLPNGKLKVEQQGDECGFGHNVRAPTAPFGKSATANQSSTTLDAHAGIQGNDVDLVFLSTINSPLANAFGVSDQPSAGLLQKTFDRIEDLCLSAAAEPRRRVTNHSHREWQN